MNQNPIACVIAGTLIVGVAGTAIWGLVFVLELLAKTVDKTTGLMLLSAPLILFIVYLVGQGFLEYRQQHVSRK
ncbi:MAG: hypothetical protein IT288_05540 [Bdellovibrionales bacterium]|nr:hypothetical protein [Bdellovibrionales bacterium]